jgi:hypothetical protein
MNIDVNLVIQNLSQRIAALVQENALLIAQIQTMEEQMKKEEVVNNG